MNSLLDTTFLYVAGFFVAISLGSFYTTLWVRILRYFYGRERKLYSFGKRLWLVFTHPSHCDTCGKKIGPLQLLPVIGVYLSGKKCKDCGSPIPLWYSHVELAFGVVFLLQYTLTQNFLYSLVFLAFAGQLLLSAITDAKYFSLDYENLPFILALGLLTNYLFNGNLPGRPETIVLFSFLGFYLVLHLIIPAGIGLGDVIFAPPLALLCGHPWWIFYLNSSYILAVLVTIALRKKGEKLRGKPIPMGMYLAIGTLITYLAKEVFAFRGNIL